VFVKTPKPGKVKTRLLPAVSPEVAGGLHAACIADSLLLVRMIGGVDAIVFAPVGRAIFRSW
jgi:glycosyltransferase A (GT-A) superfamily protein (DUF2064 family)